MKVAMITQCYVCGRFQRINGEWSFTDDFDKIIESVEEGLILISPTLCKDCRKVNGVLADRHAKQEVKK